jgi:large conductance mechanosensitive channel
MTKTLIQQFVDFLKTFGVIGLAIAFVIGQASSNLVQAFVVDIINPFIGLFVPSGNLDTLSLRVTNWNGNVSDFEYGHLLSNIITFLIIAFIVFLAYKELSRLKLVEDKTIEK